MVIIYFGLGGIDLELAQVLLLQADLSFNTPADFNERFGLDFFHLNFCNCS